MASFKIVLPLLFLGLIEAKAIQNQGLTYFDALTIAVTSYNEKTDEKNSFWFTAAEAQPKWDNHSRKPHYLSFTVKETTCLTTENITPVACDFKENGKEKYCQGIIKAINEKEADVWVKCAPLASHKVVRAKREVPKIVGKIFKKVLKEAIKMTIDELSKQKEDPDSKANK
ncbi:antibacterial peptide PMAP-23-like [Dromiciops gliroides]|uniref:antibacterial peptide PMAP-23-like n=1 Tax=Dromiciops gliroides TaxID=33562 RepID=UPI001CC3A17A|nr:antibacterial peptide PMAP-23-like [Dromiciops gliroides]